MKRYIFVQDFTRSVKYIKLQSIYLLFQRLFNINPKKASQNLN